MNGEEVNKINYIRCIQYISVSNPNQFLARAVVVVVPGCGERELCAVRPQLPRAELSPAEQTVRHLGEGCHRCRLRPVLNHHQCYPRENR